jgi:hypothetical protein
VLAAGAGELGHACLDGGVHLCKSALLIRLLMHDLERGK